MLPKTIDCPHCNVELELEESERSLRSIKCPACGKEIRSTFALRAKNRWSAMKDEIFGKREPAVTPGKHTVLYDRDKEASRGYNVPCKRCGEKTGANIRPGTEASVLPFPMIWFEWQGFWCSACREIICAKCLGAERKGLDDFRCLFCGGRMVWATPEHLGISLPPAPVRSKSVHSKRANKTANVPRITDCKLWKCPNCNALLEKSALGVVWMPHEPITRVAGTGTCLKCGGEFAQSDIYGGRFDAIASGTSEKSEDQPKHVSIVAFRIPSHHARLDAHQLAHKYEQYCRIAVQRRFPDADMKRYYVVDSTDDLTTSEAYALYQESVRKGQLPDLGPRIDSLKGSGPQRETVVALFFRAT